MTKGLVNVQKGLVNVQKVAQFTGRMLLTTRASVPPASKSTPRGALKDAFVPVPSAYPPYRRPARVVTTPVEMVMRRMRSFPQSAYKKGEKEEFQLKFTQADNLK